MYLPSFREAYEESSKERDGSPGNPPFTLQKIQIRTIVLVHRELEFPV